MALLQSDFHIGDHAYPCTSSSFGLTVHVFAWDRFIHPLKKATLLKRTAVCEYCARYVLSPFLSPFFTWSRGPIIIGGISDSGTRGAFTNAVDCMLGVAATYRQSVREHGNLLLYKVLWAGYYQGAA